LDFPANWREANFTKVSYRAKRKAAGSWINIVTTDGLSVVLGKFGQEDVRKKANKAIKVRLEAGTMPFAELRRLYELKAGDRFEHIRNDAEIVPVVLETTYGIPDGKKTFIKLLFAKSKKPIALKGRAMKALSDLTKEDPNATLAVLRQKIENADRLESSWQFEYCRKETIPIQLLDEPATQVPIEYEDAQQAEDDTLIELKGWHDFKRALASECPDWWGRLQAAYLKPQTDAGLTAARQLDEIAELLTKAQTDADVADGLVRLGLTPPQIKALEPVRFKQYRSLSLVALRKILPGLESGKTRTDACKDAGYETLTHQRAKFLPPLETYLYERIRHGKKTTYTERRYKDLTNPVVARAFNQARLVINALIDRYDSPAYVHIELARDIARPLKGRYVQGKYIEGRLDIQKKQEENRNKRNAVRQNFTDTHKINSPTARQILKERLYHEQQCKCVYTLECLDLDSVVKDENYAQLDHIWPRSRTFDNSMENLVLVHAHANQDKGNRIPYDFIIQKYGEEHWRRVMAHVIGCHGISGNKQKRLLATELDADEFSARNLVDTRYSTRLFARMVRDRLLFAGQIEDRIDDIDPSESGKSRLEKFHKTRVRTPQGGLTAFLRRSWLGDIKDREASDKHHALDACIVAACNPKVINEVNSYFANEEKVPSRFKKNADGTYTDRDDGSGEIISKKEARERGLYLPMPWDGFRMEFLDKYESLFVSRAIRKKRSGELHDANPSGQSQQYHQKRVPLRLLSLISLETSNLPPEFLKRNESLVNALRSRLELAGDDASKAFQEPFFWPKENGAIVKAIRLPAVERRRTKLVEVTPPTLTEKQTFKRVALNKLTLDDLAPESLGVQYHRRNLVLITALRERLELFEGNGEKAFASEFRKPINSTHRGEDIPAVGPVVRKFSLPIAMNSGVKLRGGVTGIGGALFTQVFWTGAEYFFRPRYATRESDSFGIAGVPSASVRLFDITQNDLVEVILKDGQLVIGYMVMYETDGRLQIRDHDRAGKGRAAKVENDRLPKLHHPIGPQLHRFSVSKLASIRKFQVDVLGGFSIDATELPHGLA